MAVTQYCILAPPAMDLSIQTAKRPRGRCGGGGDPRTFKNLLFLLLFGIPQESGCGLWQGLAQHVFVHFRVVGENHFPFPTMKIQGCGKVISITMEIWKWKYGNMEMDYFHHGNGNQMKVPGWRQEMKITK